MRSRVLFVDDEPNIRLTLPVILQQHGFGVTTVATVEEALQALTTQKFDVLIADLNIGQPGDGFTIVSAMRRTQPACINLILTGYPAFESALQAIRSHVDDYLVKPADIQALVQSISEKLAAPVRQSQVRPVLFPEFLRQHEQEIVGRTLAAMKGHPRLSAVRLTEQQRTDHIPLIIHQTAEQLESGSLNQPTDKMLEAGAQHGEQRRKQGYTLPMVIDDTRVLVAAIYEVLQDNMMRLDLSTLMRSLSRLNDTLDAHLQEAVQAFMEARVR
jgi:ActR/RegA family two-component response regulator